MTLVPRLACPAAAAKILAAAAIALAAAAVPVRAADPLLEETIGFTGAVLFHETGVPALLLGVVRDGETAVVGFGEVRDGAGTAPDGDTPLRIGSITKAFTGAVLASLAADGTLKLTDPLSAHLDWGVKIPSGQGRPIRLIDLATHASGLPREVERPPGPPGDPYGTITREAMAADLEDRALLFPPGTGILYSNFAYDLLAQALASAASKPYLALLQERVLDPAGLKHTGLELKPGAGPTPLQGHGLDGAPQPDVPPAPMTLGSGALYSTANDILRWIEWHLATEDSEFGPKGQAEMRLLDHAAWIPRDRMSPVYGMDESGRMDAMGLGWVVMYAEGGRPTLLQKAGGWNGVFTYMAFAPGHRIGAFVAVNTFDFSAAMTMAEAVNDLIGQLAPR